MSDSIDELELDQVLSRARAAAPGEQSPEDAARLVRHARLAGAGRDRARFQRSVIATASIAAAVAAAAAVTLMAEEPPRPARSSVASSSSAVPSSAVESTPDERAGSSDSVEPLARVGEETAEVRLATGDRIVTAPGTRFVTDVGGRAERTITIEHGAMLFDVRSIPDRPFVVVTPRGTVIVLGTVFSVRAGEDGTTVHVYEGRVRVQSDAIDAVLAAGQAAHLSGGGVAPDELAAPARRFVSARAAEPSGAERPRVARAPGPAQARRWIAAGDPARALAAATDPSPRGVDRRSVVWRVGRSGRPARAGPPPRGGRRLPRGARSGGLAAAGTIGLPRGPAGDDPPRRPTSCADRPARRRGDGARLAPFRSAGGSSRSEPSPASAARTRPGAPPSAYLSRPPRRPRGPRKCVLSRV